MADIKLMSEIDAAINYLVTKKFGIFATFVETFSQFPQGNVSNVMLDEKAAEIEAYKATLRKLSENELLTLHKQMLGQDKERNRQATINEENNRFYNLRNANADFNHWAKAEYWTLDEAIALSFGKEPKIVNLPAVQKLADKSAFCQTYAKRYDLAKRATLCKQFNDAIPPDHFLNWAYGVDIELPQVLIDAVKKYAGQPINWLNEYNDLKSRYDEISEQPKPESTRKSENLLQALAAIAIDAYGYDPDSAKSTAPKDIADALARLGQKVDPKTIRGWLKEGSALLPRKPDND